MREEILDALREVDATVGLTMADDAPYDFLVDDLEPTIGQAITVERLSDAPPFDDLDVHYGVLIAYDEMTDECWACGVGTYQQIGDSAFEPIHDFF